MLPYICFNLLSIGHCPLPLFLFPFIYGNFCGINVQLCLKLSFTHRPFLSHSLRAFSSCTEWYFTRTQVKVVPGLRLHKRNRCHCHFRQLITLSATILHTSKYTAHLGDFVVSRMPSGREHNPYRVPLYTGQE